MARIGFIGLGRMGGPMARNLIRAGHEVTGFDLAPEALEALTGVGGQTASSASEAAQGAEVIVTMLPTGRHLREVLTGEGGVFAAARKGAILIDSSTIDVETTRDMHEAAEQAGIAMLDAPVSGGVKGANEGTLAFMAGGAADVVERARPVLEAMGRTVIHAGPAGSGQAAKLCNNLLAGISMIGVSEAFVLAEKLGLDHHKLYDIVSASSGNCWSLTTLCPVPGPVPTSPANNEFKPGFAANLMLKDLRLGCEAATATRAAIPLGRAAARLYEQFVDDGYAGTDYSGIIQMLRGMSGDTTQTK